MKLEGLADVAVAQDPPFSVAVIGQCVPRLAWYC